VHVPGTGTFADLAVNYFQIRSSLPSAADRTTVVPGQRQEGGKLLTDNASPRSRHSGSNMERGGAGQGYLPS